MYGTIRGHQEKHYPGRPVATHLGDLDFAKVGEGLGAHAERVTSNEAFPAAFARAMGAGRPAVIELVTNPERLSAWA
jgi:acetolactate synthase-1/2/3 large subunit